MMRFAVWSDGHSILPVINERVDAVVIAGDIVPLDYQRNEKASVKWLKEKFMPYVEGLPCNKVFVVPGNHDFVFQWIDLEFIKDLIKEYNLEDKLIYLEDSAYEYNGLNIYGCPWCTGPLGWAFSPNRTFPDISDKYNAIPENCDILITHQPPKIDKVGCSYPYQPDERDFGSDRLRRILDERHIKYHFCGHIHSGIHGGIKYGDTMVYNVSLLDEDYEPTYNVTYVDIDTNNPN